jgi:hypothetical protein
MPDRKAACPLGELVQRNGRPWQSSAQLGSRLGGELRKQWIQSLLRGAQRLDSFAAGQPGRWLQKIRRLYPDRPTDLARR